MGHTITIFEDIVGDVFSFMFIGQPDRVGAKVASHPSADIIMSRVGYIDEEVNTETLDLLRQTLYSRTTKDADNEGNFLDIGPSSLSIEQQAELLDGVCDSIYVLIGALIEFGMHDQNTIWKCWREVQRSNMAKYIKIDPILLEDKEAFEQVKDLHAPNQPYIPLVRHTQLGTFLVYRHPETKKVLKPKSWTPPDIHAILLDSIQRRFALDNPDTLQTSIKSVGSGPFEVHP